MLEESKKYISSEEQKKKYKRLNYTKTALAFNSMKNLMKKSGADKISKDAVKEMVIKTEEYINIMTKKVLLFTRAGKRKTITKEDVLNANKM